MTGGLWVAATLAVLLSAAPSASAAVRTWTGATSDNWWVPSNWDPNGTPADYDHLVVRGGDVFTLGMITTSTAGSITLDGPAAHVYCDEVVVADGTYDGRLDILNGAGFWSSYGSYIGYDPNSTGVVTVSGPGSTWTNSIADLEVGRTGSGTLNVIDGGAVLTADDGSLGNHAASSGEAMVSGAGSKWTIGDDLSVGVSGTGSLTILDGGRVSNISGFIARGSSGSGEVVVNGAGSTWTNSSHLRVGYQASGSLDITGGGRVSSTYGHVGHLSGSSGAVTVSGAGSTWTNQTSLYLGLEASGVVGITDGGRVSSNTDVFLGWGSNSTGEVALDGIGSIFAVGKYLQVGHNGTGVLNVSGGGQVTVDEQTTIGWESGATGTVTIHGFGSSLTAADDRNIFLGGGAYYDDGMWEYGGTGDGTMTISGGGSASCRSAIMGYNTDASGQVTATGEGTTLTCTDHLYVGRYGTGTLTIADGALVHTDTNLVVAQQGTSTGTVNLEGGTLSIDDINPVGGTAHFNWTGGRLHVRDTGGLTLGVAGLLGSHVNLSAGKTLDVINDLAIDPNVTLSMTGGSLAVDNLDVSGTAQLRGGNLVIKGTFVLNGGAEMEIDGQDLALATTPTLGNGSELTISDATLSVPSLTVLPAAKMNFDSGLVSVDGILRCENVLRVGAVGTATIRAAALQNVGAIMGRGSFDAETVNAGNMALSDDSSFNKDFTNNSTGKLIISGGSGVTFYEDVVNDPNGEIRVSTGCTATYFGSLSGTGNFTGTGTSYIEGDMRPGSSPGATYFEGDVVFGWASGLETELGGTTPGIEHDQLDVAGDLSLGGTLNVTLVDTGGGLLSPQAGDFFDILNFGTISGDFTTMNLPTLDLGLMWNVGFLKTTGELLSTFMGDINGDLMVGVTDLGMLANQWGTGGFGQFNADITGDGIVSVTDLGALAANWGASVGPSLSSGAAVPAPSAGLAGLALLGVLVRCRRHARIDQ